MRRESPRTVVAVYIPEYVVGHWWEHILHNQSALRLKTRLLFTPGVMVTSVPWQLHSSDRRATFADPPTPGDVRRGRTAGPAPAIPGRPPPPGAAAAPAGADGGAPTEPAAHPAGESGEPVVRPT
jgi:hypothetical protein